LLRSSAGVDTALLNQAMDAVWTAYYLADFCATQGGESRSDAQRKQEDKTLVLTMQAVAFAGLAHSRCWHRLLGLMTPPWPSDQAWERFVRPASGEQSETDRSLWTLCGVRPDADFLEPLPSLAPEVRALGLRTLALYLVSRPESARDREWRRRAVRLSLWAAELNRLVAEDCRARNLMEAAFLLADDIDGWLELEDRTVRPEELLCEAGETFNTQKGLHPGLVPYMELLELLTKQRLGKASEPMGTELSRLEGEFEVTGDMYFVHLMREMQRTLPKADSTPAAAAG
jgi:hypothetical protein